MINLKNLPRNRHLYEINSYDWLDRYPKQCPPIGDRLRLLFEDMWHENKKQGAVDTSDWTYKDVPHGNGYKTILSIWFLLQEKIIKDPITINYCPSKYEDLNLVIEPGSIRTQLLPYLPNQKIRLITFNTDNYLDAKYEKAFNELDSLDLEDKKIIIPGKPSNLVGIYKREDRLDYAKKCQEQKIKISYNEKGLTVNNKLLIKFKNGRYFLTAPKTYRRILRK